MKKVFNSVLALFLAFIMVFGGAPLGALMGLTDLLGGLNMEASAAHTWAVGDIGTYGSYPQTRVTDATLLTALNAQTLTWVSYGYYSGTGSSGSQTQSDYMKYADITYSGSKYRAVKFTSYRPYWTYYASSASNSCQDENGYSTSTTYWFKYEPLEWRVLSTSGLLMCESIIDSQHFYPTNTYPTWANSSLRTWLNGLFYSTAFTSTEQSGISSSTVSTPDYNGYDGGVDTTDKLYLLSRGEVITTSYGFSSSTSNYDTARRAQGSDYAKCQGLYVYNSAGEYYGNSYWWLRSPGFSSSLASYVYYYGYVYDGYNGVFSTDIGVRPAFRISNLSSLIFTSSEAVPVTGVSLDEESLALVAGETAPLAATVEPADATDKSVAWTSSDENVATVSQSGVVTAKAAGTATITAVAGGLFADTCEVTITAAHTWAVGDIGTYGSYPQTRVTDATLLTALNAQTLTWVSYGYYISGTQSDYMKYADITYSGSKYRAVKFTSYRPYYTTISSSASNTYQDDNGYSTSTTYWFKYEPLEWRVLSTSGLLMCESIIDSQHFYPTNTYPTWANSSVRTWLNGLFYNTAFTSTEQSGISSSTVSTPDYNGNDGGVDTTDKFFLLSRGEVMTTAYGFSSDYSDYDEARRAQGSDYAKCQGLYTYSSAGEYYGNSYWWLRSPGHNSYSASNVSHDGHVYIINSVNYTVIGVRPAFRISNLSSLIFTPVSVTGVSLSAESLSLVASETAPLAATVEPADATNSSVTWSSSDENVATVSTTGLVTAKAEGTATITVTTTDGGYIDTCLVTVTNPYTFSDIDDQTYTGYRIYPTFKVYAPDGTRLYSTDYDAVYGNNINAGTATIAVTGTGEYTDLEKTLTFTILPRDIDELTVLDIPDYDYTGSAITPGVTMIFDDRVLTQGRDYTLTYSDNTDAGTAAITITGKGNFSGTRTVSFNINEVYTEITALETVNLGEVEYNTAFGSLSLPSGIKGTTEFGVEITVPVVWDSSSYSKTTVGSQIITGTATAPEGYILADGLSARATVTVLPQEITEPVEITGFESVAVTDIPYYTTFSDIGLPATVTADLKDGGTVSLTVTWNGTGYDPSSLEDRTVSGTVRVPYGYYLADGLSASITASLTYVSAKIVLIDSVDMGLMPLNCAFDAIGLPKTIAVTTDKGAVNYLSVAWSDSGFDSSTTGVKTINGVLTIPAGYVLDDGLENVTTATVTISDKIIGSADIVFLIDTTGSMSGEITNVKNNIKAFSQALNSYGVVLRWALIEYRDITCDGNASTKVHLNGSDNWYMDVSSYETAIAALTVNGGGDREETVIDALEAGQLLDLRETASKFFIAVTDANWKVNNQYGVTSMPEEISRLVSKSIITSAVTKTTYYDDYRALTDGTGGILANIDGNFKDELMKIVDMIYCEILDLQIESIDVTEQPAKTSYLQGERFDGAGMVVTAYYKNGTSREITAYTVSPNGTLKITDTAITVDYRGYTDTVPITVTEPEYPVVGVTLSKSTLALVVGYSAYLTATVNPSNATNKAVTWESSNPNTAVVDENGKVSAQNAGTTVITVTTDDGGFTAACTVTVTAADVDVESVELDKSGITLYVGDKATLNATVIPETATDKSVTWSSNASGVAFVSQNGTVTGVSEGTATITVTTSDGGYKAYCFVTVKTVNVTKIEIKTLPDKTVYFVGDTLDTTGLTLTATYNNGTTQTILSGYDCNPTVLNTAGTQEITVTFEGKTCTFDVTVTAVTLTKIEIKTLPDKTSYFVGDTLDPTGLTLTATYNNGHMETITTGFTCNPTVLNTAGTQTITVTYGGFTDTFDVTVTAVVLTKIEIKTLPNKTSYYVGDTLDTTGLTLTATYNNGHTDTITTGFTCNPTALNTAGTQTITVTYGGKDCTFPVTVSRINASGLVIAVIPSQTYTGHEITPFLTVTYNGVPLSPVTEYTAAYTNNINAGTATVTVTGIGRYTGTKTATFTILPRNISYAIADIIPEQEYTGSEITPDVALYDNGKALVSGTDYTTAYADNITIGTATVTLTGKGNYTGTKTVNFQIVRTVEPTFTVADIANQKYTGFGINPAVKAYSKADNSRLTNTIDYTANYRNNILPGTATAVVTGRGSHSGVVDKDFGIVRESITAATVEAIPDMTETGGALTPIPVLTYKGRQLVLGVDFTAEYANNVNPDTATVTITGIGGFEGTTETTFTIVENTADFSVDALPDEVYTGGALTPTVIVRDGLTVLEINVDYTVSYSYNINVGYAVVTITGMGAYDGTFTVVFCILSASIETAIVPAIPNVVFDNKEITPDFGDMTITYGGVTLEIDVDFKFEIYNNYDVGTATIILIGIGNFSGMIQITFNITSAPADSFTVGTIGGATYTGGAVTPAFSVTYGGVTLRINVDYTVVFVNNVNAGTATVIITGIGNYSGETRVTFTINAANASGFTVTAIPDQTYTGSALTPTVVVKFNGVTLTLNTDYTVTYTSNTNAGTATVTITGKGNFTDTKPATFNIIPANASGFTVTAIPDQTYTGSVITPVVVVKFNGDTLVLDTDYTVEYKNNINAGTATVTITGKGNYTGTTTATFNIIPVNASGFTVTAIPDQTYTGSAITPTVVVKFNGETLVLDTDYTVAYTNNTNVGKASVTITGKGNFTDTKSATFTINAANASGFTVTAIPDKPFTGGAITPTVVVKFNGETLTLNTDYTVTYSSNTNAGTATVIITGIGNYSGETQVTFTINAANASGFTVTAIPEQTFTGSALTPTVVVKFNGVTLTLNTDYTVTYTSNTNAGTATVTIKGMGNFTDTTTETFNINPANISSCEVTAIPDQTYTGSAITPIVVVKFNGETLTLNTDYTVAYTNNTNVGTATVTITGIGNFTGTTTETFEIVTVPLDSIALNTETLSLQYKSMSKLTVTFNPTSATNKSVTWSSSNENVATVDANGKVTAKGTGTATITATTVDGGKTASCTVTVKLVWWQWLIKILLFGWIWY